MSEEVYDGQDLRMRGDAGMDISTANPLKIKFQKPNGDIEERAATLDGTTKAYIDLAPADTVGHGGNWQFRLLPTIGGKLYKGKNYIKWMDDDYS